MIVRFLFFPVCLTKCFQIFSATCRIPLWPPPCFSYVFPIFLEVFFNVWPFQKNRKKMEVAKEKSEMLLKKSGKMKNWKKNSRKLGNHRKQIERQNHGFLSTHCFSNFLGWSILFYLFYDFLDFQGVPGIGKHKYMIDHCLNVCILTDRCMMVPNIMNTCNVGPPSYKLVYKHQ